jgi:hypothetical protein
MNLIIQSTGDSPQPCPDSAICPARSSTPDFCNTLFKPNKDKTYCEVTAAFIGVMSAVGIGEYTL